MAKQSKGDKFPLLINRRWAGMLRMRGLLIAIAGGAAWWYAPENPLLADREWLPIVAGVVGALIFLYSLLARRAAYVQCLPNYVRVRTPFLSVAISYKRILQVRPTEFHSQFPPTSLNSSKRRLVEPFFGHTAVTLELSSFPLGERQLRLWLPWYMFTTEVTGFVLVVQDWMALSRQINDYADQWVTRRQARQRQRSGFMR